MLLEDKRETLALMDKYESWMDGTCMRLEEDDTIVSIVSEKRLLLRIFLHDIRRLMSIGLAAIFRRHIMCRF